jgi:Fic family protein
MRRKRTGRYETSTAGGERVRALVPHPLPPQPPLHIDAARRDLLDTALLELGRLDSAASLLPDLGLFLYSYVRKEAVLSSQIEGTRSSLSDLLLFEIDEAPGVPLEDATEVSNYVMALEHGLARVRAGMPINNRLVREVHAKLLARGRGSGKEPGEFRRSQNWIGGSRPGDAHFVPPPPQHVRDCMGDLEKWINDVPERTSPLLKAALAHVQFEMIHPFLDGNGRVGRLLVTLIFCAENVLREPLLYLSLFLKRRRAEYYALLDGVRASGDWESWLTFFASGVAETARSAVATARRLAELIAADRDRVQSLGRVSGSALRVHRELQRRPLSTIQRLSADSKLTQPAVIKALGALERLGMVRETTGRKRGRIYAYAAYLDVLAEGTEPLG